MIAGPSKRSMLRAVISAGVLIALGGSASFGLTWEPRIQLSSDTSVTPSLHGVAGQGSRLFVVYVDWSMTDDPGLGPVMRASVDGGLTFTDETPLPNLWQPSIAYSGGVLHLVGIDKLLPQVVYRRSTDDGVTWSTDSVLSPSQADVAGPSVFAFQDMVIVTWIHVDTGSVMVRASHDGGLTFAPATEVVRQNTPCCGVPFGGPSVAAGEGVLYLAARTSAHYVKLRRSLDGGVTWEAAGRWRAVDHSRGPARVAAHGTEAVVVAKHWDGRHGHVAFRKTEDRGRTWASARFLSSGSGWDPTIIRAGGRWRVAFYEDRGIEAYVVMYRQSRDGIAWTPAERMTPAQAPEVMEIAGMAWTGSNQRLWIVYQPGWGSNGEGPIMLRGGG